MTDVRDLDEELQRLAVELIGALRDEPVPPAIRDLAQQLQTALEARQTTPAGSK